MKSRAVAFTLIELLIVVAIIAILAAIAVPNFLEAQTRAKVSRAKADMRSMSTALETYILDNNTYVYQNRLSRAVAFPPEVNTPTLERLTTPISYLTGITGFRSPFKSTGWFAGNNLRNDNFYDTDPEKEFSQIYWYNARNNGNPNDGAAIWGRDDPKPTWYFTHTAGPKGMAYATNAALNNMQTQPAKYAVSADVMYDPTNGSVSNGAIWRVGGSPTPMGKAFYDVANGTMR